jgi:adenine-specific DNA-methyltransferase
LETIAKWDNPKIKGVTGMSQYENQKSEFCNARTGIKAINEIIKKNNFKQLLLSYNDDGIMPKNEILKLFNNAGKSEIAEQNYQRYKSNSNGKKKRGKRKNLLPQKN